MTIKQLFQTDDGVIHNAESEAFEHAKTLINKDEAAFKDFCQSYSGKRILEEYSLAVPGIWEIRGEDPNCDFGGYHHQPYLETVNCTLEKAIKYAVTLDRFFTWGGWWYNQKVKVKNI